MFVWKHSPGKDAAKTFIRWFMQPGRLEPIYKASPGQHWPIYKSDIDTERVKTNRLLARRCRTSCPTRPTSPIPATGGPEMGMIDGEKMFAAPVNEVVVGTKTPEQAVLEARGGDAEGLRGLAGSRRRRRPGAVASPSR